MVFTLNDLYISVRESFIKEVAILFQKIAVHFGFPENPGMPFYEEGLGKYYWDKGLAGSDLPVRKVPFPPATEPNNILEIILGDEPKVQAVTRVFYESKDDGYFSFYIENYKNLKFFPNAISEFLQIKLNFCLDIEFLEIFRETLFTFLVVYYYLISFRVLIAWLISINPYTFPFIYLIALTDWIDELSFGSLPVIGGVSLTTPALLSIVGKLADSLNYLVFTMPYLPSEGRVEKLLIDGEVRNILRFKYLPILWYKYPIPNELREYWYNERPDILKYLQESYDNLDIQFLPDGTVGLNSQGSFPTNSLVIDNLTHVHHFNDYFNFNHEIIVNTLFHTTLYV